MRESASDFVRGTDQRDSRLDTGPDQRQLGSGAWGLPERIAGFVDASGSVRASRASDKVGHLVDAVAGQRAGFFREIGHFDFLRDVAIPELAKAGPDGLTTGFRSWSVACATGEEPYSIALTLAEAGLRHPWRVTATDTSARLLEQAAAGIYEKAALGQIEETVRLKHFEPCPAPQKDRFQVRAALRSRVDFQRLSLLQGPAPRHAPFHAIFCRDVMMYFDPPTQRELCNLLLRQLVPGGYLFVGHAECLADLRHAVRSIQPAVYRKPIEL